MKTLLLAITLLAGSAAISQDNAIQSKVYSCDTTKAKPHGVHREKIFSGSGTILSSQAMHGITIAKGAKVVTGQGDNTEHFYIVKSGLVKVDMKDSSKTLGRGSIVCIMPGDVVSLIAMTDGVQLYEMAYSSKLPADKERGKKAGGSFMIDWNTVAFRPHDKGGVRQFFDRPTEMLHRFDIHVTTLNPNNKSHDPHTHKNEEIILMLQGNGEMQIGTDHQKANAADVVWLGSMVLHNITNIGTVPCIYYAIQWN